MLALPLVPARSIALVFILSIALALISAAVPWLARHLHGWPLVIGLVVGVAVGFIGAVLALPLSLCTDLVVLTVAWSAGVATCAAVTGPLRTLLSFFSPRH